jgi:hypothetical protein
MFPLSPLAIIGLIISMLHIYPVSSWPANACKLKTKNNKILANGKVFLFCRGSVIRCPVDLMLTQIAEHAEASTCEERGVVYRYFWVKSCGMFR